MNNLYAWKQLVPAKLFAVVTLVSLILSAFPAHFLVANAQDAPVQEIAVAVDYCDPTERPAGMSIAQWHDENQFDGTDCFDYTVTQECGSLDVQFTENQTPLNFSFYYAIGNETPEPANWEGDGELPVLFDEDEYGGSVDVTYYVTGQESDFFTGSDVPNIWDGNGTTVTVDTDCEEESETDLRICKLLVDEDFEAIDGDHLQTLFSVRVEGPEGFDETVEFDTALDLNTKLLNDTGVDPDAECVLFEDVATGKYTYEEEVITGDGDWQTPLYHDFFTKVPTSQADFGEYTIDGSNEDNDDTDGVINLGKNKTRTLAIWNSEEPKQPVCEIGENLLDNGSFEEPVVTDKKNWFYTPIVDWVITALSDDEEQDGELHRGWEGNQAADGEQYAELDSRESVKMAQTIATVEGATYELKWAFAPRHNIAAEQNQLSVQIDDTEVATEGPTTGAAGLTPGDWTYSSYTFMAESAETEIAFADVGPSNSFGTFLDDTALCFVREPVPEPEEPDFCAYEGKVISTDQGLTNGGAAVDADRSDPSNVEDGVAGYNNWGEKEPSWSTDDFYSLGITGELVYEFTNKIAVNQPGDDIAVWEITGGNSGQSNEKADVYLSEDGVNFEFAEQLTGDGAVDIADTSLDYVKFVKLVDQSTGVQGDNGDGFDVDAITIIDGSCDDSAIVHTTKIVCEDEADLPNYGTGGPNMTETTATDWISEEHPSCEIVDGWEFEWAPKNTNNPDDELPETAFYGSAGGDWTTFTGSTAVPASSFEGGHFWVREVLQEEHIPFTFGPGNKTNEDDYSAELYCHKDVLNFDNYDRVDNPKAGGEYYCIGWNVPAEPEQCELDIYSDEMTLVDDTNELAVATYDGNTAWTADIPGATWVWATEEVENPESEETYTFVETFEVENPTEANITIAYDNWLKFYVNGTLIDDRTGTNGYRDFQKQTYDILSELVPGENRIEFEITNEALDGSDYRSNPAGVLFHLLAKGDADSCDRTTEPKDEMYLIDGHKYEGQYVREEIDIFRSVVPVFNGVPGLPGWTIELYDGDENFITSTTTDAEGYYYFWVPEGEYEVREVVKPGWMQVGVQDGDDYEYPDGEPYGCYIEFPLEDTDYDYSEAESGQESDYRCDFYNVQDEDEFYIVEGTKYEVFNGDNPTPRSGWTIYAGNGLSTTSAVTDGSGNYSFELPAGEWEIFEAIPSGWFQYAVEENDSPVDGDRCTFDFEDYGDAFVAVVQDVESDSCDFYNEQNEIITTTTRRSSGGGGTLVSERATQQELVAGAATSFCPFLEDYMQVGWENDTWEVTKLKLFLNMIMGEALELNGDFDAATDAAVKRFQERYKDDVLSPWFEQGIVPHDRPTGFVYKTTRWKINDIVCPGYEPYPSFEGEDLNSNVDTDLN